MVYSCCPPYRPAAAGQRGYDLPNMASSGFRQCLNLKSWRALLPSVWHGIGSWKRFLEFWRYENRPFARFQTIFILTGLNTRIYSNLFKSQVYHSGNATQIICARSRNRSSHNIFAPLKLYFKAWPINSLMGFSIKKEQQVTIFGRCSNVGNYTKTHFFNTFIISSAISGIVKQLSDLASVIFSLEIFISRLNENPNRTLQSIS